MRQNNDNADDSSGFESTAARMSTTNSTRPGFGKYSTLKSRQYTSVLGTFSPLMTINHIVQTKYHMYGIVFAEESGYNNDFKQKRQDIVDKFLKTDSGKNNYRALLENKIIVQELQK